MIDHLSSYTTDFPTTKTFYVAVLSELGFSVQAELSFPVAHGVTRDVADAIGAWWDTRRDFIQPSEFILDSSGRVLSATYSTGPVGRLDAKDALSLLRILKARSKRD